MLAALYKSACQTFVSITSRSVSAWFRIAAAVVTSTIVANPFLYNVLGTLTGGLVAFANARPDDGLLEVGVVTADSALQWARVLSRLVIGHADRSPLAQMAPQAAKFEIKLDRPTVYELDGETGRTKDAAGQRRARSRS